jgi:hypothetical protein
MKRAESISSDRASKRVRISEEKPDVHQQQNDALSEQERSESWWTQSEYAEAKDFVKKLCRGHRKARRYSDCLNNAYTTACAMASSVEEDTSHQQEQETPDATLVVSEVPPPDEVSLKLGKISSIHYSMIPFSLSHFFIPLPLDRVYFVGLRITVPGGWKGTLADFTPCAVSGTCRIQSTLSFWNRHGKVYPTNVTRNNWLDKPS